MPELHAAVSGLRLRQARRGPRLGGQAGAAAEDDAGDAQELHAVGWLAVQTLLLGSIAYALWTNRSWSRPLMVAYWLVSGAVLLTGGPEAGCAAMQMLVPAGLAAAYLYGSEGPKAYYRVVAQRERAAT